MLFGISLGATIMSKPVPAKYASGVIATQRRRDRIRGKTKYYRALQRDFIELDIVSDLLPWDSGGYLLRTAG
jgi:hypothetical protein